MDCSEDFVSFSGAQLSLEVSSVLQPLPLVAGRNLMQRYVAVAGGLIAAALVFTLNAGKTSDFVLLQIVGALVFVTLDLNRLFEKELNVICYLLVQLTVGYFAAQASVGLQHTDLPLLFAFMSSSVTVLNLLTYLIVQGLSLLVVSEQPCVKTS
jgi:hypothetical protein